MGGEWEERGKGGEEKGGEEKGGEGGKGKDGEGKEGRGRGFGGLSQIVCSTLEGIDATENKSSRQSRKREREFILHIKSINQYKHK